MAEQPPEKATVEQLRARIRELEDENRKWMRLAGTNRLTGLPNSLMFYQVVLPRELRKAGTESPSLACAIFCPDGLGEINLQHGRLAGDQLIQQMGKFLKEQTKPDEQLFHLDGTNFAILMLEATEGRVRRKATEVKNAFREATFTAKGREFTGLTCSVGVTTVEVAVPESEILGRVEQIYHDLSDRLYKAKERGGNTIIGSPRGGL